MPIDYKQYPPNWKTEIRPAVLKRANNRCEVCGVPNYSVGYRIKGRWIPTCGNIIHDAAGKGELNYKEAVGLVKHCNNWCDDKLSIIVLTIAHLDHDKHNHNVTIDRLKALCQRCHLQYDIGRHVANRKYGRRHSEQPKLF